VVTQAAAIATSVYLHRGLAHRALRLHPLADWGFRFVLWFTTGQNRREWVAVHRLWNVYYYVREARNPDTLTRWAKDIRDDVWDRAPFNRGTLGGAFGIAAAMLVLGPGWGLLLALTHFILYVFVLAPSINGLGHWWGRRKFGNNSATNLRVLAWLTGGESLHNNHHAHPSSPKFSMGRFEFDPSWMVIRVLVHLRLARLVGDQVQVAS